VDDANELHGLRVVLQRLAHAHHDDVRQSPATLARFASGPYHLRHNLPGAQVAREPHQASGAECTAYGAPDLAGDADRSPVRVEHEHCFQELAISRAIERLDRLAIVGGNGAHSFQRIQGRGGLEFVSQRRGKVLHGAVVTHELAVRPVPYLACTVRGVPQFLDASFQLSQRQVIKAAGAGTPRRDRLQEHRGRRVRI
jgi:hypothetical protein